MTAPPAQRATILVVDDTPDNLKLMSGLLKDLYKVKIAINGEKALAIAHSGTPPDLILLDIMMPGMDGYEVCQRLKGDPATRDIPIIFLTAKTEVQDEEKGLKLGAVDYITKPVNPPVVLARVETHLSLKSARDGIAEARDQAQAALTELKATQEQLVQAEKLAALTGLVAGIAHEINTPVGIALTAATTLDDETTKLRAAVESGQAKKSHVSAYLDVVASGARLITGHCQRAGALIQSFKKMAVDQTSDQRRSLDLAACLGDVASSLGPEMKKTQVSLAVNCPPGLMVETFPGALSQIISNLVMNAIIHGFDEGRRPGQITLSAAMDAAGQVVLHHADTGRGVPAAVAGRIFEPFFTTRRGQGGSGLGLGIVYNLVTGSLGGTIHLEETPGGGATFVISFPAKSPEASPAPQETRS